MTNKERLISLLGFSPPDNLIEGALIDGGVTSGDAYDGTQMVAIKKVAIGIFEVLLTTADTVQGAEINSFSIKYDRSAVEARIKLLKGELGLLDDTQPYITSRSVW